MKWNETAKTESEETETTVPETAESGDINSPTTETEVQRREAGKARDQSAGKRHGARDDIQEEETETESEPE